MAFELNLQERQLLRDDSCVMKLAAWILESKTRVAVGVRKHLHQKQQNFPTPANHAKIVLYLHNLRANDNALVAWLIQEYHSSTERK